MARQHLTTAVGLVLCLTAAACGPEFKEFTSAAPPEAKVELVQVVHDIPFGGDELYLSDAAGRRLDEFISTIGLDNQDRVVVIDRDLNSPWSVQRAESVRLYLNRHRITNEPAQIAPGSPPKPDTVSVVVERYVLAALNCPNWTQPRGSNPENATHRNFGCSDAHNLGQMLADKRDLAVGRTMGPADGLLMARQVLQYRRDVQKPLEVSIVSGVGSTTQQQNQGAGGAGGGTGATSGGVGQ